MPPRSRAGGRARTLLRTRSHFWPRTARWPRSESSIRGDEVLGLDGWVLPDHQGRGLGSTLGGRLGDETRARGTPPLSHAPVTGDPPRRCCSAGGGWGRFGACRMAVELDSPPPEPVWAGGFEVST